HPLISGRLVIPLGQLPGERRVVQRPVLDVLGQLPAPARVHQPVPLPVGRKRITRGAAAVMPPGALVRLHRAKLKLNVQAETFPVLVVALTALVATLPPAG